MAPTTRVLIVDDSLIFRKAVESCLAEEDDIVIGGSVRNGRLAIEHIREHAPDVVTLDLEMPEMDGLETLAAIQQFNREQSDRPPIGCIMLSAFTRKGADVTMRALEAGAFDFIAKPDGDDPQENAETLRRQLVVKIRHFATRFRKTGAAAPEASSEPARPRRDGPLPAARASGGSAEALLVGASTGGPRALLELLPPLCEGTDLPILVVQHMPPTFTASLAHSLDHKCRHTVREGEEGELVEPGRIYIAPGGKHMIVRRIGLEVRIGLNEQPPEHGCRPAVDVLFRAAANVYGARAVGLILTGMGHDGTRGAGALQRAGARIFVQDEATSVVWGMPGSAFRAGVVDAVLPLKDLPDRAIAALGCRGGRV